MAYLKSKGKTQIRLTKEPVMPANAMQVVQAYGKTMANVIDVVMDLKFLRQTRRIAPNIMVDWKDAPQELGWYYVNRLKRRLESITAEEAEALKWHERLIVGGNVASGVQAQHPLNLGLGDWHERLGLWGAYSSAFVAPVAQKGNIKNKLRT